MIELWRRHNSGVLAEPERRALAWLAARMPRWITPDILSAIGLLGALIVFGGYTLAAHDAAFLWLASVGLAVNWLGDSLDGTLARSRAIERPRYGFFLDNALDVVSQALLTLGIALSGFVDPGLCLIALSLFLMLSILSLLRAVVTSNFHMAFGPIGPTEIRILFIAFNALMYVVPPEPLLTIWIGWTYPNLVSATWSAAMAVTFAVSMVAELKRLSAADPPGLSK